MGVPALSGEDASVAMAFPGLPQHEHSPLTGPTFGQSCMLPGQLHACHLHEVTYLGGNAVLEGWFNGLSLEHVAG